MKDTLTKESFWDEMEQKYPKAMEHFKEWIDKYKSEHDWDRLFNHVVSHELIKELKRFDSKEPVTISVFAPKYHELPIAMQFGIFLEYHHTCVYKYGIVTSGDTKFEEFALQVSNTIAQRLRFLDLYCL